MKSFPWRFAAYFIAAVYLFADLYACRGPLHRHLLAGRHAGADTPGGGTAAEVYGRPVTLLELRQALRAHLWRSGESWEKLSPLAQKQTRWLVLENLVNDRIIHSFRIMNGLDQPADLADAERELRYWEKQFEPAAEATQRLAWQHLTEDGLSARIRAAQEDEAWVTQKIAHRLAEVTDEQVREWYAANQESLRIPSAWHAAHLYLTRHDPAKPDREAEIRELHRRLTAGEATFAQLAAETSDDERTKPLAGDLGWFTAERMPADFIAHVQSLKPGETSTPVQTRLGWHIIRLIETRPARVPALAEVEAEVRALLVSQRREQAVQALIAELRRRSLHPTRFLHYNPQVIESATPAPL